MFADVEAPALPLPRRRLIILSSHFAAHLDKVDERNADYAKIARTLRFGNTSAPLPTSPKSPLPAPYGADPWAAEPEAQQGGGAGSVGGEDGHGPGLRDAEVRGVGGGSGVGGTWGWAR